MNPTARTWAVGGGLALALGLVLLQQYQSTGKPRLGEKPPEKEEAEEAARKQTSPAAPAAFGVPSSPCLSAAAAAPPAPLLFALSPTLEAVELMPGVVHLKRALALDAQLAACGAALHVGHAERRWWCQGADRHGLSTATPRGDPTSRRKTKPPLVPGPLAPVESEPSAQAPAVPPAAAAAAAHWQLTGARQGRGRCYDAIEAFDCPGLVLGPQGGPPGGPPGQRDGPGGPGGGVAAALRALAADAAALAQGLPHYGSAMPSMEATHLLLLYYATSQRLGWHRDNGAQDGASLQPVVSLSLGDACDFCLKTEPRAAPITVRLESGDVILFGGPARHVMHAVDRIYPDTGPPELAALDRRARAAHAPDPAFAATARQQAPQGQPAPAGCSGGAAGETTRADADPEEGRAGRADGDRSSGGDGGPGGLGRGVQPAGFRVNLTFRHAPELCGRESEERFYHFASATRGFWAAQRAGGTAAARGKRAPLEKQRALAKREARRAGRREVLAAAAQAKLAAAQ